MLKDMRWLCRLSTTGLLVLLCLQCPAWYLLWLGLIFLDIFSHWVQMYSSLAAGDISHKVSLLVSASKDLCNRSDQLALFECFMPPNPCTRAPSARCIQSGSWAEDQLSSRWFCSCDDADSFTIIPSLRSWTGRLMLLPLGSRITLTEIAWSKVNRSLLLDDLVQAKVFVCSNPSMRMDSCDSTTARVGLWVFLASAVRCCS